MIGASIARLGRRLPAGEGGQPHVARGGVFDATVVAMRPPTETQIEPPPLLRLVSARQRWLYQAVGIIFVVIGAIGALLPVMPTTPFLLISLWAFDRSSPRLHAWLWYHRWFGPGLRRWHRERTIAPWVKVFAIASMLTSTAYATWGLRPRLGWLLSIYAVMAVGIFVVARLPTTRAAVVPPA